MRIIIAGDGETGTYLAGMLSVENQDVVLIGSDKQRLSDLEAAYNFITHAGSPTSVSDLMQCGADKADIFIAVTPDENINIVACGLAKRCGTKKCVARIDNPEFATDSVGAMLKEMGVDRIVYPERLAAERISHFISHNWVNEWFRIRRGELMVLGMKMTERGTLCGKMLKDATGFPRAFHVSAISRGERIIIPRGDDVILPGDTVYFSTLPENLSMFPELCGKTYVPTRKIMVTGGGRITENLLKLLGGDYEVTVIEPDRERCRKMALQFPKAVFVNSTSNDVAVLKDEGINGCDMFLALTGSSEANIVSCMVAREHGVAKTLARIEELQYIPEAESLAIDKIVNKKQINTGMILNVILDSDTEAATTQCLSLDKAEITAIVASEGSKITSRTIGELSLPRELTIGGLIRNGKGMLVDGRTRIEPGDLVVVFFLSGGLAKVKRLF